MDLFNCNGLSLIKVNTFNYGLNLKVSIAKLPGMNEMKDTKKTKK